MRDIVTNKQLYDAIMEVHTKIDVLVDNRISPLERTVERLKSYILIAGSLVSIVISGAVSYFIKKN